MTWEAGQAACRARGAVLTPVTIESDGRTVVGPSAILGNRLVTSSWIGSTVDTNTGVALLGNALTPSCSQVRRVGGEVLLALAGCVEEAGYVCQRGTVAKLS